MWIDEFRIEPVKNIIYADTTTVELPTGRYDLVIKVNCDESELDKLIKQFIKPEDAV